MPSEPDLSAIGTRIERLLVELRVGADPRRTADLDELLRLVTELYGAGLARVVEVVGAVAPEAMGALVGDELLSGLFALHDLHPDALTTCVSSGRSRVCARCSPATAETSSWSTSIPSPGPCCCACSVAVTGARRRR